MYNEWQGLNITQHSPTMSRDWLMQMGKGAAKSNVSIQYCMTFARMVLQTAEIPAVTTFRASDDYGPGQTGYYPTQKNVSLPPTDGSTGCGFPYCVYYVGTTSILAWGMDLGPSKVRGRLLSNQHANLTSIVNIGNGTAVAALPKPF